MLRSSACDSSDGVRDRRFDVCIVGGGAAGSTLAMELRASALSVCVLEGGTLSPEPDSQGLYRGMVDGVYAHDLDECRARWLGGSTNYWPGTCTPLDALDFEHRDWIPDSDWPFGHDALAPYYPLAADYCSLRSTSFRPDATESPPARALDAAVWTTRRAQVSTSPRFAERFKPRLAEAENITVVLGANVVRVACAPSGTRVDHVVVQPFGQPPFTVRAKAFVLAMGGLENARLLLVSNDVHARGIGNERDLVGRFFMDHPVIHSVLLEASPSSALDWYAATPAGAITHTNYLQLQESFVRSERATNVRVHFTPASDVEMSPAMFSYSYLRLCQRRRRRPHLPLRQLARIASGVDLLGAYFASRATGNAGRRGLPRNDRLRVSIMCEQVPHAANCARLSSARDALGLPRLQLRWRMLEEEQRRARWAIDLLTDSVRAARLGRIRNLCADTAHPFEERLGFGNHAIGTTRASDDPTTGVVDGDGRVFGVDNLFVAGSSVFRTSSHLPPTLTVVALAIRMAAHLTDWVGASRLSTSFNSQRA